MMFRIHNFLRKFGIIIFTLGVLLVILSVYDLLLLPYGLIFILIGYATLVLLFRDYKKALTEAMKIPSLILLTFIGIYLYQKKIPYVNGIPYYYYVDVAIAVVIVLLIFRFRWNICREKNCFVILSYAKRSQDYLKCRDLTRFAECFAERDAEKYFIDTVSRMKRNDLEKISKKGLPPKYLYLLSQYYIERKGELLLKACKGGYRIACKDWRPEMWKGLEIGGYKVIDLIGEGGLSYILKGQKDGTIYALKIPKLYPSSFTTKSLKDMLSDIKNEESVLVQISEKSRNIVKVYAVHFDETDIQSILKGDLSVYISNPPYIVLEYMGGGSAYNYDFTDFRWRKVAYHIISKIAYALDVIHKNGYVHSDVKPQNILFSSQLPKKPQDALRVLQSGKIEVKLSDLGSAVKIGEKAIQLTPEYASIEHVKSLLIGGISPFDDIYSLGSTVFRMLTGKILNSQEMLKAYDNFFSTYNLNLLDPRLYYTRDYSPLNVLEPDVANFILYMTSPARRPTAIEVANFFYSKSI